MPKSALLPLTLTGGKTILLSAPVESTGKDLPVTFTVGSATLPDFGAIGTMFPVESVLLFVPVTSTVFKLFDDGETTLVLVVLSTTAG